MKVTIIAVGKLKEKYLRDAAAEYIKRLGKYCKTEILEVDDEQVPEQVRKAILQREGERILRRIKEPAFVIALEIGGEPLSSEELADKLENLTVRGVSHIVFVIGGSIGLGREVTGRADLSLSFSRMTFPHQLMRVILLEQIYRSFRIINGEPYHK